MRIQESSVHLSASHEAQRSQSIALTMETDFKRVFASLTPAKDSQAEERERVARLLHSLVEAILAASNGKQCPEKLAVGDATPLPAADDAGLAATPPPGREISWRRRFTETVSEAEKTTVCGSGRVKTCDGRDIDFNFAVAMEREFDSEVAYEEEGKLVLRDPLVLSFDGQAAELTEQRIDFDLDADGQPERIPGLAAHCGFLVFDRNGNGKADNGGELFGVASGNGFADLSELDADRNGWIDEADPAFAQLAVWSGEGFDTLAKRGVGALCTAAVDAPFALKNGSNQLLGQIRSAGVYLSEAGQAGLMQQVDLAVSGAAGADQPEQGGQLTT